MILAFCEPLVLVSIVGFYAKIRGFRCSGLQELLPGAASCGNDYLRFPYWPTLSILLSAAF